MYSHKNFNQKGAQRFGSAAAAILARCFFIMTQLLAGHARLEWRSRCPLQPVFGGSMKARLAD